MARLAAKKKKVRQRAAKKSEFSQQTNKSHDAVKKLERILNRAIHVDWKDYEGPVYAVGDVHGMLELLDDLLLEIEADAANLGIPARVVFLGDLINRGPDSRQVIERLLAGPRRYDDEWLVLRGNHEQSLLDALQSEAEFEKFLQKGVLTLQSYGLGRKDMTRKGLRAALPDTHRNFLENLPLTCRTKEFLFVHAGIRPGTKLDNQRPEEMMTLREPFLSQAGDLPWTVVHGHTPTPGLPVIAAGRIGVDTGACLSGVLTAAVVEFGKAPRFLAAKSRI